MSLVCASCGQENPAGFRYCGACGCSLEERPVRELRKTVSVLFADVVGSTALGEARDPEAVRKHVAARLEQAAQPGEVLGMSNTSTSGKSVISSEPTRTRF